MGLQPKAARRVRKLYGDEHAGTTLRDFRLRAGLSQEDLARKIGVTPPTVSHYEARKRRPGMQRLYVIAVVLNLSHEEVMDLLKAWR